MSGLQRFTPLKRAALRADRVAFDLLINCGADIYSFLDDSYSVLNCACFGGSVEIVQSLLNKGVAIDVKNCVNETPLFMAVERGHKDIVELLINFGADIHFCNKSGFTLLHRATMGLDYRSVEIVQCLLKKGIALNTKNHHGDTPLHIAVKLPKAPTELTESLLKAGADYNLEDNKGESSFSYLIKNKHDVELIKLCIEKGAYVNSDDYNRLLENPLQKKAILQDVGVCSQAVINRFNKRDLPLFYKGLTSGHRIPHIDNMKISNGSEMAQEVEQAVSYEIHTKGFCNIFKMVPLVLSILCVTSSIEMRIPHSSPPHSSDS